jgi:hypothetical protein
LTSFFFPRRLLSQAAAEEGKDFYRVKALTYTVEEQDMKDRRTKKKNPDEGFAGDFGICALTHSQIISKPNIANTNA